MSATQGDKHIRIAVVGGGIVGLSVAYHLVGRGGRVDLIDAGDGPSATSRAALGVLTHSNGGDSPYARLYRDGHRGFEELADRLRHEVGVDIGWRPVGGMDLCFSEAEEEEAEDAKRSGRLRSPLHSLPAALACSSSDHA